jgi:hypothetical protein
LISTYLSQSLLAEGCGAMTSCSLRRLQELAIRHDGSFLLGPREATTESDSPHSLSERKFNTAPS